MRIFHVSQSKLGVFYLLLGSTNLTPHFSNKMISTRVMDSKRNDPGVWTSIRYPKPAKQVLVKECKALLLFPLAVDYLKHKMAVFC